MFFTKNLWTYPHLFLYQNLYYIVLHIPFPEIFLFHVLSEKLLLYSLNPTIWLKLLLYLFKPYYSSETLFFNVTIWQCEPLCLHTPYLFETLNYPVFSFKLLKLYNYLLSYCWLLNLSIMSFHLPAWNSIRNTTL